MQLTTRLQCLKKQLVWFGGPSERFGDQIEALTEQFDAKGGASKCHRQPNPRFTDEDDKCIIEEARCQWREVRVDALDQLRAIFTIVSKPQIHLTWKRKMKLFKKIFQ
jgi:hypothetical protein